MWLEKNESICIRRSPRSVFINLGDSDIVEIKTKL